MIPLITPQNENSRFVRSRVKALLRNSDRAESREVQQGNITKRRHIIPSCNQTITLLASSGAPQRTIHVRLRRPPSPLGNIFFGDYHGFNRIWRRLCYEYGTVLFNLFPLPQSQGFSGSLKYMGRLADAGVNILIFPEGGHSRDGKMKPFQLGLGIMVKELGIPVVPVKISGTEQVLPPGARFPKRGQVTVTFGKPLRFRYEEPAEIVEKTRQAVEKL